MRFDLVFTDSGRWATAAFGLMLLGACPASDDSADDAAEDSTSAAGMSTGGDGASNTSSTPGTSAGTVATTSATSNGTDPDTETGGMATSGGSLCGAPIPELDSALGMLVADYPPPDGGGGTGGTTIGTFSTSVGDGGSDGGGIPDDTMRLRFSNTPLTCEDPYGDFECGPFDKWWLTINLPAEMQAVGVYQLADLDLSMSFVSAGMPPVCAGGGGGDGGGGGGFEGELVIEQFGPDGIAGCITGASLFDLEANGSFDAVNCSP